MDMQRNVAHTPVGNEVLAGKGERQRPVVGVRQLAGQIQLDFLRDLRVLALLISLDGIPKLLARLHPGRGTGGQQNDGFRHIGLTGVVGGRAETGIEQALTGPVGCGTHGARAFAARMNFGPEMIGGHLSGLLS